MGDLDDEHRWDGVKEGSVTIWRKMSGQTS
jgi:hypothetical protein